MRQTGYFKSRLYIQVIPSLNINTVFETYPAQNSETGLLLFPNVHNFVVCVESKAL